MASPSRSFRKPWHFAPSVILLIAFCFVAGCTSDNSSGGMVSPADWVLLPSGGQHARSSTRDYLADGEGFSCKECHGDDLSGGTSQVSCFGNSEGCHHGPVAGWVATSPTSQEHGVSAKKAPNGSGLVSCQICHGKLFSGGDSAISCFSCHNVDAPHPAGPWRGPIYSHVDTNVENAPVCALCHFPGSPYNPSGHPPTPATTGTTPGCFNSTLCHGDTTAPHVVGSAWLDPNPEFHGLAAKKDLSYCQGCHGTPGTPLFAGGTASVSCQTTICHARAKAHPIPWYQAPQPFPGYVASHRDSGNHTAACGICHKTDGLGTGPDPGAPSCFSDTFNGVLCHPRVPAEPNHSVPFLGSAHTLATQATFVQDCAVCHAVIGISPNSVAPACTVCHQSSGALPFANCTSCHDRPPSGIEYPDVAGSHAAHDALTNGAAGCVSCHNGLSSGTAGHYDRANARPGKNALRVPPGEVEFLTAYDAKPGPATFDNESLTCANVSCHGGQPTPDWQTATLNAIDVPNACPSCHVAGTSQYNGYFSGGHGSHLAVYGLSADTCKLCHDAAKVNVSGHFQDLSTPVFEQPAAETILQAVGYNGTSCNPDKGGLTGCHGNRKW
jgi:predicted CxxxxCH...CXXCH cytochrome family protein